MMILFSAEISFFFTILGFTGAYWIYTKTENVDLSIGIIFFTIIELLQTIQYLYVAPELKSQLNGFCGGSSAIKYYQKQLPCDSYENKFLTLLSFIHICFQPYFFHLINASLTKSCKYKDRYKIIKRLCLIGGFLLLSRYYLSLFPSLNTTDMKHLPSTEWFRGNYLCTFKTKKMKHFGWAIPLADPSYFAVGVSIHGFLILAPFFAMFEQKGMVLQGVLLLLSGPVAAFYLSSEVLEQASIWSYFSLAQILISLFMIREVLFVDKRQDHFTVYPNYLSEDEKTDKLLEFHEEDFECRDFKHCEYCEARRVAFLTYRAQILQKLYEEGKIRPLSPIIAENDDSGENDSNAEEHHNNVPLSVKRKRKNKHKGRQDKDD